MVQRAKRVWRATRVEPGQQLLEVPLERHRARLVDKLQSGAKTGDQDGTATAVPITGAALQAVHVAKRAGGCERLGDGGPVGAQVAEEFKAAIHPSIDATDDRARHHRVFLQQRGERLGLRQPPQETVKSRLGRVAGEQSLQPRHVDLKRHGTADDVKQLRRQLAEEQRQHRVGIERHVGIPASQCLNARLQPRHALPDKGSAGVQEARRVDHDRARAPCQSPEPTAGVSSGFVARAASICMSQSGHVRPAPTTRSHATSAEAPSNWRNAASVRPGRRQPLRPEIVVRERRLAAPALQSPLGLRGVASSASLAPRCAGLSHCGRTVAGGQALIEHQRAIPGGGIKGDWGHEVHLHAQ